MSGQQAHPIASSGPWIGPKTGRRAVDRRWMAACLAFTLIALVFFGWRSSVAIVGATLVGWMTAYFTGVIRQRLNPDATLPPMRHVLVLVWLSPLSMAFYADPVIYLIAGVLTGGLTQLVGPMHRVRVHPVALAQCVLLVIASFGPWPAQDAVLTPAHVVTGDLVNAGQPVKRAIWMRQQAPEGRDALRLEPPGRVLLEEQKAIVKDHTRLTILLTTGDLAGLADVVLGAIAGPMGATSAIAILCAGMVLMVHRHARYPVALAALVGGVVALCLLPIDEGTRTLLSIERLLNHGGRVTIAYLSYQILGTPFLWIVLILAPMSMPRAASGRFVAGVLLGAGFFAARWQLETAWASYLSLIGVGLLAPLLDHWRSAPFERRNPAEVAIPKASDEPKH